MLQKYTSTLWIVWTQILLLSRIKNGYDSSVTSTYFGINEIELKKRCILWKDLVVNGAHGWWCPLRQHITYIFISPPSLFTTLTSPDNVVSCDSPWLKPTCVYNSLPSNIRSVTDFHTFFVWSAKVCFHVVHAIVHEH